MNARYVIETNGQKLHSFPPIICVIFDPVIFQTLLLKLHCITLAVITGLSTFYSTTILRPILAPTAAFFCGSLPL